MREDRRERIHYPAATDRWRDLQTERLEEALGAIGSLGGVSGVVVAGSIARGESWPMSDIDLVPIVAEGSNPLPEIARVQAALVDWWSASGRPQNLDVGWLTFSEPEVERAVGFEPKEAIELFADPRWLYGTDKIYGGRGHGDEAGLAQTFADWASAIRFDPVVRQARAELAHADARQSQILLAQALQRGDKVRATHELRNAARDLRLIYIEQWAERLGSLGREWTRFERLAAKHGAEDLAGHLADLAGATIADNNARAEHAPTWLRERIDIAYRSRLLVGEEVSEAESRRDQMAAFAHLVLRRDFIRPGAWIGAPDPELTRKRSELARLLLSEPPTLE